MMADDSYRIPANAADSIIKGADGTTALLYLYILRDGGTLSEKAAARELRRTEAEISAAAARLREMGLLNEGRRAVAPGPVEELPEYSAEDISRRCDDDGVFKDIVAEAQKKLGRVLSGADLRMLFGMYDYLSLPPEVILLLINYCLDLFRDKYGPGRTLSMRSIEKEAYSWANQEILTLEQAEEHMEKQKNRRLLVRRLREAFQIHDREFTASERKYVDSWLELGFGFDALVRGYDRTVTQTGSLKWAYMNKIILNWQEKGLHTLEEIEKGDGRAHKRQTGGSASPKPGPVPGPEEAERLRRMMEKMESGK